MERENLVQAEAKVSAPEMENHSLKESLEALESQREALRTENIRIQAFRTSPQAEEHQRAIRHKLTEEVKRLKEEREVNQRELAENRRTLKIDENMIRELSCDKDALKVKVAGLEEQLGKRQRGNRK
jgi:hypothetical protein